MIVMRVLALIGLATVICAVLMVITMVIAGSTDAWPDSDEDDEDLR